jgi:predicted dehydrogenase
LARWGLVDLSVIERWGSSKIPAKLRVLVQKGTLRYLAWGEDFEAGIAGGWRAAYVVTSATSHRQVILRLLDEAPNLRIIICEKPCGENLEEALEIFAACNRRGVALVIADHYLLRPAIQYLLAHPDLLPSVGTPTKIVAALKESKVTGPQQGVIADLLVHLLDLLLILFPGAHFEPVEAYTARALRSVATAFETYTYAVGKLNLPNGKVVRCELEGGKHLGDDDKRITITGTKGRLQIDLIKNTLSLSLKGEISKEVSLAWPAHWSYARLILRSLLLSWPPAAPSHLM